MKHLLSAVLLLCALPAWAQEPPVIKMVVPLPKALPEEIDPQGEIYCRPPQAQTESRVPGPRVCKSVAYWKSLHDQGLDVSADGKNVMRSEKYRSINVCGQGNC